MSVWTYWQQIIFLPTCSTSWNVTSLRCVYLTSPCETLVPPPSSCGHLYHASCLGLDTGGDPGHLNHSCIVCHKTSAPLSSRGRTKTIAVSTHTISPSLLPSLSLPPSPTPREFIINILLSSPRVQGPHRGRSFTAQRSVCFHTHALARQPSLPSLSPLSLSGEGAGGAGSSAEGEPQETQYVLQEQPRHRTLSFI